jgi:hypothetical protein
MEPQAHFSSNVRVVLVTRNVVTFPGARKENLRLPLTRRVAMSQPATNPARNIPANSSTESVICESVRGPGGSLLRVKIVTDGPVSLSNSKKSEQPFPKSRETDFSECGSHVLIVSPHVYGVDVRFDLRKHAEGVEPLVSCSPVSSMWQLRYTPS